MLCFLFSCKDNENNFSKSYTKFRITLWNGDKFNTIDRILTVSERTRLKQVLTDYHVKYKDTLNDLYIKSNEFYDKPEFLFASYSDFILDSSAYFKHLQLMDSIKKINRNNLR